MAYAVPTRASQPGKISGTTKSLTITVEMLIGTVPTTSAAGATIFDLPICPSIINPGPLVPYSSVWDKFVVQKADFEYRPLCATTTAGGYVMWCESNPETAFPAAGTVAAVGLAHAGAVEHNAWKPATCRMRKSGPDQRYFCQPTDDVPEWQQGKFRMACLAAVANGGGSVVCRMTIKFYNPQLNLTLLGGEAGLGNLNNTFTVSSVAQSQDIALINQMVTNGGVSVGAGTNNLLNVISASGLTNVLQLPAEKGTFDIVGSVAPQNGTCSTTTPASSWPAATATFYNSDGVQLGGIRSSPFAGYSTCAAAGLVNLVTKLWDSITYNVPGARYVKLAQKAPSTGNGWSASPDVVMDYDIKWSPPDTNPIGGSVVGGAFELAPGENPPLRTLRGRANVPAGPDVSPLVALAANLPPERLASLARLLDGLARGPSGSTVTFDGPASSWDS